MESVLDPLGPWHFPALAFGVLRGIPSAQLVMSLTFMAPQSQDHWCARPPLFSNWTSQEWRNFSAPLESEGELVLSASRCYTRDLEDPEIVTTGQLLNRSSQLVPCSDWEFDSSFYSKTILSEWRIVCGDQWMLGMSQSIIMFGFMIGNFIFSHLSDWCGRRPALFTSTLLCLTSGVAVAFSGSFTLFNAFRFLASLGHGGATNVAYTLAIECVAPQKRALVSILQEAGWVLGLMLLPGIGYFLTNWVHIQIAISLPLLLMLLGAYLLEESPRWLFMAGRFEDAERVIHRIVKRNGVFVKDVAKLVLEAKEKVELERKKKKSTVIDLFKSRKIAAITISSYIQLAVVVLLYYDLLYKISDFGGNPYLNFFLVSLLEIPVMLANVVIINYFRRRLIYFILYVPAAVMCFTLAFVPPQVVWLQLSLVMAGKLCVHCAYSALCVQIAECFPTVVRAVALGSGLTASRVGAIVAPFFRDIGRLTYPWVPNLLDTALAIGCIFLSLVLPETFRKSLPDTFKDTLRLSEKKPKAEVELQPMQAKYTPVKPA